MRFIAQINIDASSISERVQVSHMSEADYRTPGQLIADLLAGKGWTQQVLGTVLGIDRSVLAKVIKGTRSVEAKLAMALGEVFEVEPEKFMELQMTLDLAQARIFTRPDPKRAIRAELFSSLPIAEMMKRGWMNEVPLKDVSGVEGSVADFFDTESIESISVLPHAAKKTNASEGATSLQLAWLYRVRQLSKEMMAPAYSKRKLQTAIKTLSELRLSPEETRNVPSILEKAGVRFLIVENLKGAKIDGVCMWLDSKSPVVALSMRFDRVDNFWFVLRHELEHVLNEDGKTTVVVDCELEGSNGGTAALEDCEKKANLAAADFCIPQKMMQKFIAHKDPLFSERDVRGFARMQGVHPGLVAGQIQRHTQRYKIFRKFLVSVRNHIAPSALVDGWGDIPPLTKSQP